MDIFLAILLGAVFGGVQLFLLILAVRSIAGGKIKVWAFAVQFFCPIVGLTLCALLARNRLVLCASVICAILIVGAVLKSHEIRKEKSEKEKKG